VLAQADIAAKSDFHFSCIAGIQTGILTELTGIWTLTRLRLLKLRRREKIASGSRSSSLYPDRKEYLLSSAEHPREPRSSREKTQKTQIRQ
jgi:hypothetical protein